MLSQARLRALGSKLLPGRHGKDYSADRLCAVLPYARFDPIKTLGTALLLLTISASASAYEAGLIPDEGTHPVSNARTNQPAAANFPVNATRPETPNDQATAPDSADYPNVERFGGNMLDSIVQTSKNLEYERKLRLQHDQLVERYHTNLNQPNKGKQPANKTEPCLVSTDLLDGIGNERSLLFWEGSCQNGLAEGFGRVYLVDSGRKTFELLGNFHSDEPQFTTIYYAKNTTVQSQTVYFYGKANRDLSWLAGKKVLALSGIAVPQSFEGFLRGYGAELVECVRYADHHRYATQEVINVVNRAADLGCDAVITTEKDAVRFPRLASVAVPVYYLRIEIEILKGAENFHEAVRHICFKPKPRVADGDR